MVGESFPGILYTTYKSQPSPRKNACKAKKSSRNQSQSFLSSLPIVLSAMPWGYAASCTLCFEGEGGADLVGSLVELLGIKGGAEAEGDAGAEEDVVGDGCDTTVVDLELFCTLEYSYLQNKIWSLPWQTRQGLVCTCWQPRDRLGYRPWSPK